MDEKIEELDFTEKEVKEERKFPPLPVVKEIVPEKENKEITKEVKKEEIKKFNDNPRTKEFGVKLISKKTLISFYVIIFILLLLLSVNMIWKNNTLDRISNKDFSPIVNNQINPPNVTAQVNVPTTNNNYIYNNYTIVNNITLPNNITIRVQNWTI